MRIDAAQYREMLSSPKRNRRPGKYRNVKTEYKGRMYDSKKEAGYAATLDLLIQAGDVEFWIPQVSLPLNHNTKVRYIVDFLVKYSDGHFEWIDVKGIDTPQSRQKRRQIKECYGIAVIIV